MTEEVKPTEPMPPPPLKWYQRLWSRWTMAWRNSPPMDRWDRIGIIGLCLLTAGVHGLLGWRWAALAAGSLLLTLYYLGEIHASAVPKKKG